MGHGEGYHPVIVTAADIRWVRLALLQAEQAPHEKWRVGAVLIRGGSVIGTGYNRYRNDPAMVSPGEVSYHAESVALRRAGDNAFGATMYVARITKGGELGMAKPCHRCQELLITSGIHTVVWTNPYGIEKSRIRNLINVA